MRVCLIVVLALASGLPALAQAPRVTKDKKKGKSTFGDDREVVVKKDKDKDKDAPVVKDKEMSASPEKVDGRSLQAWKDDMSDRDASKRAIAIIKILQFGDAASSAVRLMINALSDKDLSPRAKACLALRVMTVHDDDVPQVVKALAARFEYHKGKWAEPEGAIRYEVALTLRRFVEDAGPAIPALIVGMRDPASWETRHMCLSVLWRAAIDPKGKRPPDEKAIDAIVTRLTAAKSSAVYQEKLEMVIGLGSMGSPENSALKSRVVNALYLTATARYETNSGRALALWAYAGLVNMSDDKNADKYLSQLALRLRASYDVEIRVQACGALGALGKRCKKYIPHLIILLSDKEPANIISAAAGALGQISETPDAKAVATLVSLIRDDDPQRVGVAVTALANMKAKDAPVLKAMEDKLKELAEKKQHIGLRNHIEQAIKYLKTPPKEKDKK
jgi:HEAT repeat protein